MSYIISTTAGAVLIMQLTQQNCQMLLGWAVWVKFNSCMCHRMGKAATHIISAVALQYKYKDMHRHKHTHKYKHKYKQKYKYKQCMGKAGAATHISAVELQYKYKYKSTHKHTYKSKYK